MTTVWIFPFQNVLFFILNINLPWKKNAAVYKHWKAFQNEKVVFIQWITFTQAGEAQYD